LKPNLECPGFLVRRPRPGQLRQEPAALAEALRPIPADAMRAYAVSPRVNDARHADARCLELAA
jgi:putative SOS response-associated peptidase YedK